MNILISDPDSASMNLLKVFLENHSHSVMTASNGKDCQLKLYKHEFSCLILDLDIKDHTVFEVLKYIHLNRSSIKIILVVKNPARLVELGINEDVLKKLGAQFVVYKNYSQENLLKLIESDKSHEEWKTIKSSSSQKEEENVRAMDEEFTSVKIDSFYKGNVTIFDHYIRLSANSYIKILHKGDQFDESRIKKYAKEKSVEYLYFKTKDRQTYISFVNDLITKSLASGHENTSERMTALKNISEKFIEEIYVTGIKPELVEEGKKVAENMYRFIQRDKGIADLMKQYEDYDPPALTHLFLTTFFSTVICENLEWSTQRTVENVALGALLHDIGKLKLPVSLRNLNPSQMSKAQLELFEQHPLIGFEMLSNFASISEPVRQIVYQHHELMNGEGFPNKLTASKIYPLAKIVALANAFANHLTSHKVSPHQGIREFLTDREILLRYDPTDMKALVMGFAKRKV